MHNNSTQPLAAVTASIQKICQAKRQPIFEHILSLVLRLTPAFELRTENSVLALK